MCTYDTVKFFSDRNCGNVVGEQMKAMNPKASEDIHLQGHCIEFKYYADGIHSGLTPPG